MPVNSDAYTINVYVTNIGTNKVSDFGSNLGLSTYGTCGALVNWTVGSVPPGTTMYTVDLGNAANPQPVAWGPSGGSAGNWNPNVQFYSPCTGTVSPGSSVQLYLRAGAEKTNCTFTVAIANNSPYPQGYGIFHNGAFTGTVVYVQPFNSVTTQVTDPACDPSSWYYARIESGTLNSSSPPIQFPGGYQVNGSTGNNLVFDGQTGEGTGTNLNLSLNSSNVFTNVDTGLQISNTYPNQTTNGPINFGPSGTPASAANNGTVEAGFNTLYNGTVAGDNSIVNAIQAADQANRAGEAAISNLLGRLTNSASNSVTLTNQLGTNDLQGLGIYEQEQQSNKLSSATSVMQAATNAAGAVGNGSLVSAASGIDGGFGASGGGGANAINLTLGAGSQAVALSIQPPSYVPAGTIKTLIAWLAYLFLFIANYKVFQVGLRDALHAPQARTAGEEILGNNVNFASALVVAGLIVALVATLPAAFLPQLISTLSHVMGTPFSALASTTGYGWAMQACPFDVMLSAIGSHLLFRMVVDGAVSVVCAVIKFLVGL
jgi:hypothetical protein